MTKQIVGAVIWLFCLIAITMAAVPPQEHVGPQIGTYLMWLITGYVFGQTRS